MIYRPSDARAFLGLSQGISVKRSGAAQLPVAIVGVGFSGTLLVVNLLRLVVNLVLVERDERQDAKGLAFGTRRPEHLINVRASNMSAFPDDLGHFLGWMDFAAKDRSNRFVPRLAYGHYLRELNFSDVAYDPTFRAGAPALPRWLPRVSPSRLQSSLGNCRA